MRNIIIVFLLCFGFVGESFGQYGYWVSEQLSSHDGVANQFEIISGAAETHPSDGIGGYVLAGFFKDPKDSDTLDHDPFLIRIDKNGNEKWHKELDDWGDFDKDAFKCANYMEKVGNDEYFFLIGGNKFLRKVRSSDGAEAWRYNLESHYPPVCGPHYLEKYSDNDDLYFFIEYTYRTCWTFDASSTQLMDNLYISDDYLMYCGKLTTDNKFIISGHCNEQLTLCRTDTDLNLDVGFGNRG